FTAAPDIGITTISNIDQYGMFASLRMYFDNAWSIVTGARLSGDSSDMQFILRQGPVQQALTAKLGSDHVVTPYAGVMYAFDRHYSLYTSYAEIYRSQLGVWERTPGHLIEPVRGVNLEAGIKSEWRNGALNGSLALYHIEQRNLPRSISPGHSVTPGVADCCYTGVSSKSRGVDAQLSGELMPGWSIGAGYTYNENKSPSGGPLSAITPKSLRKAWTNVRLSDAFSRWQVGGALQAQSETTSRSDTSFCPACIPVHGTQRSYAVLDLRAGFDVDRNWQVAL